MKKIENHDVKIFTDLVEDFRKSMAGIYSESVVENTIDESPMAYKPKEQIIDNIAGTVSILNTIRPVFNFKAS